MLSKIKYNLKQNLINNQKTISCLDIIVNLLFSCVFFHLKTNKLISCYESLLTNSVLYKENIVHNVFFPSIDYNCLSVIGYFNL